MACLSLIAFGLYLPLCTMIAPMLVETQTEDIETEEEKIEREKKKKRQEEEQKKQQNKQ